VRAPPLRLLALRPPLLRLAVLRPARLGVFRALPELRLAVRFLAPPRLRPEDPDRDLFLPLFERLDFLAAAMGMLRVGGFVGTDSKIRAQQLCHIRY
jgi:hypothetical protein